MSGSNNPFVGQSVRSFPAELLQALEKQGITLPRERELTPTISKYSSQLIAVTGVSTGDEGKGRVILDVAKEIEALQGNHELLGLVVKVNGGANSGHTANGLKLNLLPSGVAHPTARVAISCGVVADPTKLDWEVRSLAGVHDVDVSQRLTIDRRTQLSDPSHRLLDLADEWHRVHVRRGNPRGSTGRGITQAFQEEVGHTQIPYGVFLGGKRAFADQLEARLINACKFLERYVELPAAEWDRLFETLTNAELGANKEAIEAGVLHSKEVDFRRFKGTRPFTLDTDLIIDTLWAAGQRYSQNIGNVSQLVRSGLADGQYILCEFGQAYWLHVRHGYSPNVTSSRTWIPEVFDALEIPVQPIHNIGVMKAYDTKVGEHVFLSEMPLSHPLSLQLRGIERGVSTNRQRMVGWFDAVEKGHTLSHGGVSSFVINKLDQLTYKDDWQGPLEICVGYRRADALIQRTMPDTEEERSSLRPVYETYEGWSEDISNVRSFADLPEAAQKYIAAMYFHTIEAASAENGIPEILPPVQFVGVGPDPSQLIQDIPDPMTLIKIALRRYRN